jgi:hypothetical protein
MRTSAKLARRLLAKVKPPGGGALGVFAFEIRPLRRVGDLSGDRGTRKSDIEVSGAALRAAIALWCNTIARWYAAVSLGRRSVRREVAHIEHRPQQLGVYL